MTDFVCPVCADTGIERVFHKVAIRTGKPCPVCAEIGRLNDRVRELEGALKEIDAVYFHRDMTEEIGEIISRVLPPAKEE